MSKDKADYHDAELAMRVYDLRREDLMRQSRTAINGQFWPRSYEDLAAIMKADHPLNAPFRQVSGYWEMVYAMVRHEIVHPEYFLVNNGEGLFLFAKVEPYVEKFRREFSPNLFLNSEWVAKECAAGRRLFENVSARVRKMAETR